MRGAQEKKYHKNLRGKYNISVQSFHPFPHQKHFPSDLPPSSTRTSGGLQATDDFAAYPFLSEDFLPVENNIKHSKMYDIIL